MDNFQICPACQRKNTGDVIHCIYCGTSLKASGSPKTITTKGVHITPADSAVQASGCAKVYAQLSEDSLALLVEKAEEPVIINHVTSVILGRGEQPPGVEFVDLAEISDMILGISRQHARIIRGDGIFWLEDMHSTNGTWLNRKRLVPGVPYSLATNDAVWFGPVKLTVCFRNGQDVVEKPRPVREMTITLQSRNTLALPMQPLSPDYLLKYVAPYMDALAVMQQVIDDCQGKTAVPIRIYHIKDQHQAIIIHLEEANEVISLVDTFITPWRDTHFHTLQTSDQADIIKLLKELADLLAQALTPNLSETAHDACTKAILPALHTLATSQLDLIPNNDPKETNTLSANN